METLSSKIKNSKNSKSSLYRVNSLNKYKNNNKFLNTNMQKKNSILNNKKSQKKSSFFNQENRSDYSSKFINKEELETKPNMIKKFNIFLVDNEKDEAQKPQVKFSLNKSKNNPNSFKNNVYDNYDKNRNNESSIDGYSSSTSSSSSSYYKYFGGKIKKHAMNQRSDYIPYHQNYASSFLSSDNSHNYNSYSETRNFDSYDIPSQKDEWNNSNNNKEYKISFNDNESLKEIIPNNRKITTNENLYTSYPSINNYYFQSNFQQQNNEIANGFIKSNSNNYDINRNDYLSKLNLPMPVYYIDSLSESSEYSNISETSEILENKKDLEFSFTSESESLLRLEKSLNYKFPRLNIFNELKLKYGIETKSDDVIKNESDSTSSFNRMTYDSMFTYDDNYYYQSEIDYYNKNCLLKNRNLKNLSIPNIPYSNNYKNDYKSSGSEYSQKSNDYYYPSNENYYFVPKDITHIPLSNLPNKGIDRSSNYYNKYYYSSSISDQKSSNSESSLRKIPKMINKNNYKDDNNKSKKYNSTRNENEDKQRNNGSTLPLNFRDQIKKTNVKGDQQELIKVSKSETESQKSSSSKFSNLSSNHSDISIKPIIKEKQAISRNNQSKKKPFNEGHSLKKKVSIKNIINHKNGYYISKDNEFYIDTSSNSKEDNKKDVNKKLLKLIKKYIDKNNYENKDIVLIILSDKILSDSYLSNSSNSEEKLNNKKRKTIKKGSKKFEDNINDYNKSNSLVFNNSFSSDSSISKEKLNNKNKKSFNKIKHKSKNENINKNKCNSAIVGDKILSDNSVSSSSISEEKMDDSKKSKSFNRSDNNKYNETNLVALNDKIISDKFISSSLYSEEKLDNTKKKGIENNNKEITDKSNNDNSSNSFNKGLNVDNNEKKIREKVKVNSESTNPSFIQIETEVKPKSNPVIDIVNEIESKPSFIINSSNIPYFISNLDEDIGSKLKVEKSKPVEITNSLSFEPIEVTTREVASLNPEAIKPVEVTTREVTSLNPEPFEPFENKFQEDFVLNSEPMEQKSQEISDPREKKSIEVFIVGSESSEDTTRDVTLISEPLEVISYNNAVESVKENLMDEKKVQIINNLVTKENNDLSNEQEISRKFEIQKDEPSINISIKSSKLAPSKDIIENNMGSNSFSLKDNNYLSDEIITESDSISISQSLISGYDQNLQKENEIITNAPEMVKIKTKGPKSLDSTEATKVNSTFISEINSNNNNSKGYINKLKAIDEVITNSPPETVIEDYQISTTMDIKLPFKSNTPLKNNIPYKESMDNTLPEHTTINNALYNESINAELTPISGQPINTNTTLINDITLNNINENLLKNTVDNSKSLIISSPSALSLNKAKHDTNKKIGLTPIISQFKEPNVLLTTTPKEPKSEVSGLEASTQPFSLVKSANNEIQKPETKGLSPVLLTDNAVASMGPVPRINIFPYIYRKPSVSSEGDSRSYQRKIDISKFISSIRNREESLKAKENEFLKVIDEETEKNKAQKNMIQKTSDELNDKIKEVRQLANEVTKHKKILLEQKEANDQLQVELEEEKKQAQSLQKQLDSQYELNSKQEQEISYYKEIHDMYLEENQRLQALLLKLTNVRSSMTSPPEISSSVPSLTLPRPSSPISIKNSPSKNPDISPASSAQTLI